MSKCHTCTTDCPTVFIVSCDICMTSKCGSANNVYSSYIKRRVQWKKHCSHIYLVAFTAALWCLIGAGRLQTDRQLTRIATHDYQINSTLGLLSWRVSTVGVHTWKTQMKPKKPQNLKNLKTFLNLGFFSSSALCLLLKLELVLCCHRCQHVKKVIQLHIHRHRTVTWAVSTLIRPRHSRTIPGHSDW